VRSHLKEECEGVEEEHEEEHEEECEEEVRRSGEDVGA